MSRKCNGSGMKLSTCLPDNAVAVPGVERLWVTSTGQVFSRSLARRRFVELRGKINRDGYRILTLPDRPVLGAKYPFVHRLVLLTFVGPPGEGQECRHLDGNPGNDCLANLAWGTSKENGQDRIRHGTQFHPSGEKQWCHKLTECDVRAMRRLREEGATYRKLNELFGVQTSWQIVNHRHWTHVAEEEFDVGP